MTNTLAYYDTVTITAVKSHIVLAPGLKNFFTAVINTELLYAGAFVTVSDFYHSLIFPGKVWSLLQCNHQLVSTWWNLIMSLPEWRPLKILD
jgi:hypothetical protein